jgi:beta-N-acetylhexosaminidase
MNFARLFCFGFDGETAPDSLLLDLHRRKLGAVILFARNCKNAAQIRALCAKLRDAGGEDLWILVDQEGGRVRRITDPDIGPPAARDLGRLPASEIQSQYRNTAERLVQLGIDFNLAPVADVMVNPGNKVLEGRTFADDANTVSACVAAAVRGIQAAGVKACAKHFPGLGAVDTDPHHAATSDSSALDFYRTTHFPPFAAAIAAQVTAVMTTHLLAPRLDRACIATYSRTIVRDYLQGELHFDGLVLTDDLEMKALPDPPAVAAWHAFVAGHHLLLFCHDLPAQEEAMRLFAARLAGDHAMQRHLHRALDRQYLYRKPFAHAVA